MKQKCSESGTYAEYVAVPETWKQGVVAKIPDGVSYEDAAALPIGAMTALDLLNRANINEGRKVLVYGASGSVGSYAVQIAKHMGAEVTGVCSTKHIDAVKSIGADEVIDYKKEDFTQRGKRFDVVFEAVMKISASRAKKVLKKGGKYLSVKSSTEETTENLLYLIDLVKKGKIRPLIDRSFPLEEIVQAHQYVDKGHKTGNVVIDVPKGELQ